MCHVCGRRLCSVRVLVTVMKWRIINYETKVNSPANQPPTHSGKIFNSTKAHTVVVRWPSNPQILVSIQVGCINILRKMTDSSIRITRQRQQHVYSNVRRPTARIINIREEYLYCHWFCPNSNILYPRYINSITCGQQRFDEYNSIPYSQFNIYLLWIPMLILAHTLA